MSRRNLEGGRNESVGSEGLMLIDHSDNSMRPSIASSSGSTPQPPTSSMRARATEVLVETSARKWFLTSVDMDNPVEKDDASVGEAGTFRAQAIARRFVNSSRRHLLKQSKSLSQKSLQSTDSGISECTPLMSSVTSSSIPEGRPATQETMLETDKFRISHAEKGRQLQQEDEEEREEEINMWVNFRDIWFGKPISVCLVVVPLALWAHFRNWNAAWIFWLNFFVMIPLASILGDFTEEAALHTNETIGGLLNATFGNAVEVVVAIQALLRDEIRVVQASMIGSIFSNLLLVLGCCFFFGGLYYKEQSFNSTTATASMGLLALSSIAMILPTPFAEYYQNQDEVVLIISRMAAGFLLFMYLQLLIFQLYTHKDVFDGGSDKRETENGYPEDEDEEDEEEPRIPLWMALFGLGVTTAAVTIFSDYLVGSIDEFCNQSGVSRTFVGLIILPIVGNAVEHVTAVTVAMKNKMTLSMGVAIGSSTQIALFVVPVTVLVGWLVDKPMTLNFPHFEVFLYVLSIFTVSICLTNPKSNWLEGSLLVTTYIMLAIGFWFEKVVNF